MNEKQDIASNGGKKEETMMEKIVSLSKRRGFVFQGSDIYGGLAGTWDYGPLGVELKNNIKQLWWKRFVTDRMDMYGVDAAILMNARVWEASGHTGAGFADPMVEDIKTNKRYRVDHLLEENGIDPKGMTIEVMDATLKEKGIKSPEGNPLGAARQFNMMFETQTGATSGESGKVYLRPETAQGMFVNFKNIIDSMHPKLPFGLAQTGKAFRNEIAPRDFIFRSREFEQMEIEYFVKPTEWESHFTHWYEEMKRWMSDIGLDTNKVHELEVAKEDRAHYSSRTVDFEYEFPFGTKELYGIAYRTDFDLKNHAQHSTVDLSYFDEESKERFVPHVIEPTFGVERTFLAVLTSAYTEDEMNGEVRTYLKLAPSLAPYRACVSPLVKNKPELMKKAQEVFQALKKEIGNVTWDDNGNIGKRYRRQDEIGTPACVVIDFDTLGEKPELLDTVTVRDRDTGTQTRVPIAELTKVIKER